MNADRRDSHYASYTNLVFVIRTVRGNFEGAEEVFRIALDRNKYLYYKLSCMFTLAKVYIHNQKPDMAREALEFIISNGNKLHLVDEAKALLESMA